MNDVLEAETSALIDELVRIGRRAVAKAQEQNRRAGVPNVYSINGVLHYELPSGELSTEDPGVAIKAHNPPLQPDRAAPGR